jgi:hypothetical protein
VVIFLTYKSKKNTTLCCIVVKNYYLCIRNRKLQKSMKRLGLMMLCSLLVLSASAESIVRGRAMDSQRRAVGYATVAAEQEGKVVTAVAAGADGRFEIAIAKDGEYTVELSAVGYKGETRKISAVGKLIDLGEVVLNEGVAVDAVR